jgi:tRNA U34 5-methylaminomethyl-2-thiouridine-forming methyltransferase MnmC
MGTGLNILLTALEPSTQNIFIDYTAYELYPISADQAMQLNYHELLQEGNTREILMQIHTLPWGTFSEIRPGFRLCKWQKSFETLDDEEQFDLIYMDAFAPEAQPEFWEAPFTEQLLKALKPGGIIVTYCAKGSFKRALKAAGFLVEALPGPPGKREMTRGKKIIIQ